MSKRTIKAKLRERVNGAVNEQLLNYIAENISQVAYMSGDKLCFAAQCSREELAALTRSLSFALMVLLDILLPHITLYRAILSQYCHFYYCNTVVAFWQHIASFFRFHPRFLPPV